MYSNDYLLKNGITDIEELVDKSVYFVFFSTKNRKV